jgi:hypothetical protein
MPDDKQGSIHSATDGGVIGKHPDPDPSQFLVAPSTSNQFNTARFRPIPIACFSIDDVRFKFDSSFVLPDVQTEMAAYSSLRKLDSRVMGAPISIFGHADPSFQGNFELGSSTAQSGDDYNKTLSGRRAIAVYALLIRQPSFWDTLFTSHLGSDVWGEDSISIMLDRVDQANGTPSGSSSQSSSDSAKNARVHDIANDSSQRQRLFVQYMNLLCGDLKLDKSNDFLAHGAGPDQKGDVQGCSRFNPRLLFSSEDEARFKQAFADNDQPTLREERDPNNAVNRRVMILIFRKGSQVLPAKWPCPSFKEGTAGCKKRFFANGDARRSTHDSGSERSFDDTHDTFACRFYQRISDSSPCHQILETFFIRLYDPFARAIPFAPFAVSFGGTSFSLQQTADADGLVTLRHVEVPVDCRIQWGFAPIKGETPQLLFERTIFLVATTDQSDAAADKRLSNLGYDGPDRTANISGFQLDYGFLATPSLEITGELNGPTTDLLIRVYKESLSDLRDTTAAQS